MKESLGELSTPALAGLCGTSECPLLEGETCGQTMCQGVPGRAVASNSAERQAKTCPRWTPEPKTEFG